MNGNKASILDRRYIADGIIEVKMTKCITNYKPGQYIRVYLECSDSKKFREFNLTSIPSDSYLSFAFIYRNTAWKNSMLTASDAIIKGPYGSFVLPDEDSRLVMIALGIGITPFISMIRYSLSTNMHDITLLYTGEYVSYLDELNRDHKRFRLIINSKPNDIKRIDKRYVDHWYIAGIPDDVRALKNILIRDGVGVSIIKTEEFTGY